LKRASIHLSASRMTFRYDLRLDLLLRRLVDLAVSPTSGLLEIEVCKRFNLDVFHLLGPDSVDQSIVTNASTLGLGLGTADRCTDYKETRIVSGGEQHGAGLPK
jgi:hypothetical protein